MRTENNTRFEGSSAAQPFGRGLRWTILPVFAAALVSAAVYLNTHVEYASGDLGTAPGTGSGEVVVSVPAPTGAGEPESGATRTNVSGATDEPTNPDPALSPAQQESFATLWAQLHDPHFKAARTYRQFIEQSMPAYLSLPASHQNRLMEELARLRARGEFRPEQFRPDPEASDNAGPSSHPAPPTVAQQLAYEAARQRLQDPEFTRSRTLADLAALPEVASLTLEQRQQLANEAMQLLSRGALPLRQEEQATYP